MSLVGELWHQMIDAGDPMRYVHLFFGECRRSWCYCHRGLSRTQKGAYRRAVREEN